MFFNIASFFIANTLQLNYKWVVIIRTGLIVVHYKRAFCYAHHGYCLVDVFFENIHC